MTGERRTWLHWGEIYEASNDGRLRTYKNLRMLSPRIQKGRSPHYTVTLYGKKTTVRIANLVREVFREEIFVDDALAEEIQLEAIEHNQNRESAAAKKSAQAKERRRKRNLANAVSAVSSSIHMPPAKSDCQFPFMRPGIPGYTTFDDPQIDPFGCGLWWVRLDMGNVQERRKAA